MYLPFFLPGFYLGFSYWSLVIPEASSHYQQHNLYISRIALPEDLSLKLQIGPVALLAQLRSNQQVLPAALLYPLRIVA